MSNASEPNHPYPLLVVIVNYRTPGLTIDCLRSLVSEVRSLPGTQVVVGDNASGDNSTEEIPTAIAAEGWSEWAAFVPLERNGGFAFGNNALIRPALESTNP
ncbi:glycosyltransferase family 2 protein, partial [Microcoleus sp. LEGE 07076]|uniref:glycosyltransferase family 2 protein n=1 Tax=Microcoleus sp. LEGE 07076 TaxID=915322 RepID=UPI001A0D02F0|nr:glycosyltransferase family 2 protein [Microcoleus sp. LEGE 07076]